MSEKQLKIISFKTPELFNKWLAKSHVKSDGIWMRIYKKDSGIKSISYQEALEEALCYGWIDGQKKSYDELSWIQKFTPRRLKSIWSKRNTLIVQKLVKETRMQQAGLKVVEEAKADGRWQKAYPSQAEMKIPDDFLLLVKKNKKAHEFFKTLSKSSLYSIGFQLYNAKKDETRQRRIKAIIDKLTKGQK